MQRYPCPGINGACQGPSRALRQRQTALLAALRWLALRRLALALRATAAERLDAAGSALEPAAGASTGTLPPRGSATGVDA